MSSTQPLSRSSSSSSVLTQDSSITSFNDDEQFDASTDQLVGLGQVQTGKRTRKRFTNSQLIMLEQLFHQCSHPSREAREALAKDAGLELRSVTVWFQNKRQTERRSFQALALHNATNTHINDDNDSLHNPRNHDPDSTLRLDAPLTTMPSSNSRSHRSVSSTSRPSLDHIASRHERPERSQRPSRALSSRSPSLSLSPSTTSTSSSSFSNLPSTPSKNTRLRTYSSPTPLTPDRRETGTGGTPTNSRPIWENMLSSPIRSSSPSPVSSKQRERDVVAFALHSRGRGQGKGAGMKGAGNGTGGWTLEWACALARVNGKVWDDDQIDDEEFNTSPPQDTDLDFDVGGDTEPETEPELQTPSSSMSMSSRSVPTSFTIAADGDEEYGDADTTITLGRPPILDTNRGLGKTNRKDTVDKDMMDAALVLCGLGGRP
ncbi:Homeobox DNA-binding [Abortiporus biennis]